jgi:predicted SAM-dependent methyltransferase
VVREHIKQIIELISTQIDLQEPIIELGSLQVEGQIGYADLRPFFPGKRYIGCDFRHGPGVDRIEDPEAGFSFANQTVGTVLCCDTFEHIFDIFKTVREIERVLVPGGILVTASVMYWPIHSYPYDYWRFTPECFRRLLDNFTDTLIISLGDERFPHTIFGMSRKGERFPAGYCDRIQSDILSLPSHEGSAWRSPRERELEKRLQEAFASKTPESNSAGKKDIKTEQTTAASEKLDRLRRLLRGFTSKHLRLVKKQRDELVTSLQQTIQKHERINEDRGQQLSRRDRIIEDLRDALAKKEEVREKLQKKLEIIQTETNEIYIQYSRLLNRLSAMENSAGEFNGIESDQADEKGTAGERGRRLNIGCGRIKKPGYLNVDIDVSVSPDVVFSLSEPLPFGSDVFDQIEAYHVVEHIYPWTARDTLKDLWRILRPGGKLAIECPNIEFACASLTRSSDYGWDSQMGMWAIYGDPNAKNPLQMHHWGYTPLTLSNILQNVGFVGIKRESPESHVPERDFRIVAIKLVTKLSSEATKPR